MLKNEECDLMKADIKEAECEAMRIDVAGEIVKKFIDCEPKIEHFDYEIIVKMETFAGQVNISIKMDDNEPESICRICNSVVLDDDTWVIKDIRPLCIKCYADLYRGKFGKEPDLSGEEGKYDEKDYNEG